MTTALDDIESAAKALNDLTAQEAVQKAAIDASVAAALKAVVGRFRVVFIDAVAGLDTNDGTAPAKAVATLQAATALVSAGQIGIFQLLSDIGLASGWTIDRDVSLYSYGVDPFAPGAGGTVRTVKVLPSATVTSTAGTYSIPFSGSPRLTFSSVNLAIGAFAAGASIFGVSGEIQFSTLSIGFDPALAVPLIGNAGFMRVLFRNVTLPANFAGKLIAGVPAGGNPNSPVCQCNLTSV